MIQNSLAFYLVVGATALEFLGTVVVCRHLSRPTWRVPVKVAKLGTGRMTSDSDIAGMY